MGTHFAATRSSLALAGVSGRQVLSTDSVPASQRLEYWLDMICAAFVRLESEPAPDRSLFGDIEFSRLGSLDFTRVRSNAMRVRRTPALIRGATDDCCLVQIQRKGRGIVFQDGRQAVLQPGDFVLYDTTRPYELIFDDPLHEVIVLRLARNELESHVANTEDLTATTVSRGGAAGNLLLTMVDMLRRDIDRLHPSSALGVSEGITSIIAAGLRSLPGANLQKPSNLRAYHLARIKAHVRDRLRDPQLSVQSVAAAVGLSAKHVHRLFAAEPVPLAQLIWRLRLEACRRDLADERLRERSVSEIAFSWGFNDATHFSRSFRERYGVSPREWRRLSFPAAGERELS